VIRAASAVLAATALLLAGCGRPPPLTAPAGVTLTPLRTIPAWQGRVMLRLAGVKGARVDRRVDLWRVEYSATLAPGRPPARLSGLLALPRGAPARRLVSFQHGTSTTRDAVPSQPDGNGIAGAIAFAGAGYALVEPDYPGMGKGSGRHTYFVTAPTVQSVTTLIDIAERESILTAARLRARGTDAQAVDVGPIDHDGSVLAAAPSILAWLKTLERNAP
jgi:hypothetical protein